MNGGIQGYVPDARQNGWSVPYSQCQLLVGKYEYPPQEDSTEPMLKKYASPPCPVVRLRLRSDSSWTQRVCLAYHHVKALLLQEGRVLDLAALCREHRAAVTKLHRADPRLHPDTVAQADRCHEARS